MKQIRLLLLVVTLFLTPCHNLLAKTKEPPVELLGALKATAPYGAWINRGESVNVEDGASVPFNKIDLPESDIAYSNGAFTLPNKGVYLVTFSVTTKNALSVFELQLSGKSVMGGKLTTHLDLTLGLGNATITVMVPAKAKETLKIVNKSGSNVSISAADPESAAAYLSIVQIH